MKKIMIGVLVLIPILIVLIVGLVTNFVSTQVHIGVDSVTFDKSVCYINLADVPVNEYGERIVNLNDYLKVTVLPEKATNRDALTWEIDEIVSLNPAFDMQCSDLACLVDESESGYVAVQSNSTGLVMVNDYCHFSVTVSAEQQKATCLVEITDSDVQGVTVQGTKTLNVGESALLSARYSPLGSLVTQGRWESSDTSVVAVDANGIITALKAGTADITMYATQAGTGEEISSALTGGVFTVTVNASLTLFGTTVNVAGNTFALADAGLSSEGVTDVTGGSVADGTFTFAAGAATAELTLTGGAKVTVVKCEEDDFVIENADLLKYDATAESPYIVATNGIPLKLSAVWQADIGSAEGAPQVEWSSTDESVALIDEDGVVTPVSTGEVVLYATCNGKTQSLTVFVAKKTDLLNLVMTDSSLKVGLALETVFASQEFGSGYTLNNNSVAIGIAIPTPVGDDFYNDFNFSVDKPELARFEGNVLVFDSAAITERTDVTVTVAAKYPRYPDMTELTTAHVTLSVVPGVEVSTLNELFTAAAKSLTVTAYTVTDSEGNEITRYEDRTPEVFGIVLLNDICYTDADNTVSDKYGIDLCCSLYGNGHMLYSTKAYMDEHGGCLVNQYGNNTVVSNLTISANHDAGEEISNFEGAKGLNGYCIKFNAYYDDRAQTEVRNDNVTMEYSIIQNSGTGIGLHNVDIYIDGCVVRNLAGTGIYMPTNLEETDYGTYRVIYSVLTTHNCVMSNLIGTAMSMQYYDYAGLNAVVAQQAYEQGKNSMLIQRGFLDIYNWQTLKALNFIDRDTVGDEYGALVDAVSSMVGDALADPVFSEYVKEYNGDKYIHMGFISTGFVDRSYATPDFGTSTRFLRFDTNQLAESDSTAVTFILNNFKQLRDNPIYIWCYSSFEKDITPGKTYVINNKFIERLHQA